MKKFGLSLLIGYAVNLLVGSIIAMKVISPMVHPMMGEFQSSPEETEMLPILIGYFLITLMMVLLYPHLKLKGSWLKKGLIWGLATGVMSFVSTYLIMGGGSPLPTPAMLIAGVFDTISIIITGIVIAFINRNEKS